MKKIFLNKKVNIFQRYRR